MRQESGEYGVLLLQRLKHQVRRGSSWGVLAPLQLWCHALVFVSLELLTLQFFCGASYTGTTEHRADAFRKVGRDLEFSPWGRQKGRTWPKPAKLAGQDAERARVRAGSWQGQRTFSQPAATVRGGVVWRRPCRTMPVVPCSRRHYLPESPRSRSLCKPIHPSRSTQVLHDTDYGGKRLTYDFFCKARARVVTLKSRMRAERVPCLRQALCLVAVNMYPNMDWEASLRLSLSLVPSRSSLCLPPSFKIPREYEERTVRASQRFRWWRG